MKIARRNYPDHQIDCCKRSSTNRIAAGSRLPRFSHGFFSFLNFSNTIYCNNNVKQAVGPGVLQTFSTCAVKP